MTALATPHAPALRVPANSGPAGLDDRAPGERYYRHPGDVIRLVAWSAAALVMILLVKVFDETSDGVRADLGQAATNVPDAARQLLLAVVQLGAVVVPVAVVGTLAARGRWRRLATLVGAGVAGAGAFAVVDALLDPAPGVVGSIDGGSWWISTPFPTPLVVAAIVAVATVGKPWLARTWRHAADASVLAVAVVMATAGTAGVPELALAVAVGGSAGCAMLVALGAPNRRPSPASIAIALAGAGIDVVDLDLRRAVGGRAQLFRASTAQGPMFLKVYGHDSRDADVLYRAYRTLVLRDSEDGWPTPTLAREVEHEAYLLMFAATRHLDGAALRAVVPLPDGSIVLAMNDLGGRALSEVPADEIRPALLDDVWRQVVALHHAGLAHRALRAANVLVADDDRPVIIDLGAGRAGAGPRAQAIDRAEMLSSLAAIVGVDAAVSSAARVVEPEALAAAMPFLQPLALSAGTRKAMSGAMLRELRDRVAEATRRDAPPLERLIRVRPRTIFMIATLTGAFYILLPQLASVDDSVEALRSANWMWLAGAVAMSACTYLASGIGMVAATRQRLPLVPTTQVSLASSFVNRVTPANVGGMALNVRYLQKSGVPPAEAVTGVGLNVLAGGVVHVALLAIFLGLAGRDAGSAFHIPGSSKILVVIAVVLALAGLAMASKRGRTLARSKVVPAIRQSLASVSAIAQAPGRLCVLVLSSAGVSLAYIGAVAFAVAAFDGGVAFAQVGAVYLGASLIAAAAPTPGGLGAIEAALVAGLTGVGMDPAIAVAAVLSYRVVTYWLPVLPGWLCFRMLERRNYI